MLKFCKYYNTKIFSILHPRNTHLEPYIYKVIQIDFQICKMQFFFPFKDKSMSCVFESQVVSKKTFILFISLLFILASAPLVFHLLIYLHLTLSKQSDLFLFHSCALLSYSVIYSDPSSCTGSEELSWGGAAAIFFNEPSPCQRWDNSARLCGRCSYGSTWAKSVVCVCCGGGGGVCELLNPERDDCNLTNINICS